MKTSSETWVAYFQRKRKEVAVKAEKAWQAKAQRIYRDSANSGGDQIHTWRAYKHGMDVDYTPGFDDGEQLPVRQ